MTNNNADFDTVQRQNLVQKQHEYVELESQVNLLKKIIGDRCGTNKTECKSNCEFNPIGSEKCAEINCDSHHACRMTWTTPEKNPPVVKKEPLPKPKPVIAAVKRQPINTLKDVPKDDKKVIVKKETTKPAE